MKKKNIIVVLIVLLTLVASLTGCSGQGASQSKVKATDQPTAYPCEMTDDQGSQISLKAAPTKVVSLSPANTEIICALGAKDLLVGRTDYCDYPADVSSVPSIGDYYAPNVEKIISLAPDLVVASEYIDADVKAQLEGAGAVVCSFCAFDVDTVEQDILKVGQLLNKNGEAAQLVDQMETARQALVEKCAKAETKRSAFIDLGEYYSSGDGSLQDNMLKEINVTNIAAGTGEPVVQLSVEQIITANPDVYISEYAKVEDLKKVAGFDALSAVKENRMVAYDYMDPFCSITSRPGPRVIEGLEALAKIIYPELF